MADQRRSPLARAYAPSALPSTTARVLAFLAILLGGLCGGLIGYSVTDLQCGGSDRTVVVGADGTAAVPPAPEDGDDGGDEGCDTIVGLGALGGAVVGAGGVAVIAVLVLRAMAEWRRELEIEEAPPDPLA